MKQKTGILKLLCQKRIKEKGLKRVRRDEVVYSVPSKGLIYESGIGVAEGKEIFFFFPRRG